MVLFKDILKPLVQVRDLKLDLEFKSIICDAQTTALIERQSTRGSLHLPESKRFYLWLLHIYVAVKNIDLIGETMWNTGKSKESQ